MNTVNLRAGRFLESGMKSQSEPYQGQFEQAPDLLYVAIPRSEILIDMAKRDDMTALNDVCLAVAVVADAIGHMMLVSGGD